ncbi:MAG: hypothetical protein JGK24_07010 [Microcoleus sp. PH2017_29_MFU_D_A]|nr:MULTISPECIES: hypothetical protein [unclassified Microcoleus]MCC3416799.1 hypothetical protein [Microcoleus sp. PH2017_07_MST_O_A]MCC3432335.1 hypothetical protein [Microcoleus sp. PH2017_04_SCI_O_A]MCC3442052.1 hypothetical protein [Microcoleus sp. PH2017_03_ELD_O_A]MCC3464462.1 hypothetical protein [Microcoleus sp. PH2017_06_SFM_O_A]MCC3502791.1 hypothetical protein [Microcoleus sp. PH2017_19_SFW_U_A]MCC3509824.1 hypothetical protein [Microcoleus sp. PH2017_17_BER_D_A]
MTQRLRLSARVAEGRSGKAVDPSSTRTRKQLTVDSKKMTNAVRDRGQH